MTRRFFSGTSVEQAVMLAARHHGISPDELAYKELQKRHGFLRVGRKCIVEVDPDNPRRAAVEEPKVETTTSAAQPTPDPKRRPAPSPVSDTSHEAREAIEAGESPAPEQERREEVRKRPRRRADAAGERPRENSRPTPADDNRVVGLPDGFRPVSERYPAADGVTALATQKAVKLTLELLEMEAEIDVRQGEGQLEIELITEDKERLLEDDGRALDAIQHLTPRLVRGFIGEGVACRVDCDNFLLIHEERLRDLAQRSADEAKLHGRPWLLKPMTPEERRIVHLALVDDSAVETQSVGDGFFKRVRIRPI